MPEKKILNPSSSGMDIPDADFRGGGCGQGEQTVGYHPIFAQKVCKNI